MNRGLETEFQIKEDVRAYLTGASSSLAPCCQLILREHAPDVVESFLYHIWENRHMTLSSLKTTAGQTVTILNWGLRNLAAGPDYHGVVLKIDGKIRHGDVEMHLYPNDWHIHGHDTDSHYNHVILHVVLWCQQTLPRVRKQNGRYAPTLVLSHYLDENLHDLQQKLTSLQVNSEFPCQRMAKHDGPEMFVDAIKMEGQKRIEAKVSQAMERYKRESSWDEALYQGIAIALGYSRNKAAFEKLTAQLVPYGKIQAWLKSQPLKSEPAMRLELQGIFFGAAGFLAAIAEWTPLAHHYGHELIQVWERWQRHYPTQSMSITEWSFSGLRPLNFPTRRLAALVELLLKVIPDNLIIGLQKPLLIRQPPKEMIEDFHNLLTLQAQGFWQDHYHFSSTQATIPGNLIGEDRRHDIMINIVFPTLIAYMRTDQSNEQAHIIWQFYQLINGKSENRVLRLFAGLWQLSTTQRRLFNEAMAQQGLIQLYADVCEKKRCAHCWLAHPYSDFDNK